MSRYDELEALKKSMGKGQPAQPKKSEAPAEEPAEAPAEEPAEDGDEKPKAKKRVVKKEE